MIKTLKKLANNLIDCDLSASNYIYSLAARYEKIPNSTPEKLQHAYKYIMYLKLMHNIDDSTFYHMKRKYLNCSLNIQEECRKELDKIISKDALDKQFSSAEIRIEFAKRLKEFTD